ncbi:MAG: hypothetical protein JWP87_496 [Labilithrix sp.]|nr:hypothetical protein [Labilithrix sp.]
MTKNGPSDHRGLLLAGIVFLGACVTAPAEEPSVTIDPLAGPTALSGDVPVKAAFNNFEPTRVEYVIDDQLRRVAESAPYEYVWPTAGEMNAEHTLTVRAFVKDAVAPVVATATLRTKNKIVFSPPLSMGPESAYFEFNEGELAIAQNLLDDVWPARAFNPPHLAWPLSWQDDPANDAFWRFYFYALRPTASLLWAWTNTKDARYLDKLTAILRSYVAFDKTRSENTLTFDDKHTAGYRAMVLTNTYVKLKNAGVLPPDLDADLLAAIAKLGAFLAVPKNFEATYNHGFNEALGLLLVAHNFAAVPGAPAWRELAVKRLSDLLPKTIDADGVETENSPFYHLYVLGIVSQIAEWAKENEPSLAGSFATAVKAMMPYAAYVTQPNGWMPMLGATASTVIPDQDPAVYGSLTAYSPEFEFVFTRGTKGTAPAAGVKLFPTAGLFVMRAVLPSPAELSKQTFITFDAGPYRTNHSDLDGLSITMYGNDLTLLPDSGLFTYTQQPDRDYFHGSRSHNTVVVDGRDQPIGAGTPTPGAHGEANGSSWSTGTSTLNAGVTHRRTVVLLEQDLALVVDNLSGDAPHRYTQTWHLFPGADIVEEANGVIASTAATKATPAEPAIAIRQANPETLSVLSVKGGTDPMQGWQSMSYGIKTPSWAIEHGREGRDASFATMLVTGALSAGASQVTTAATDGGQIVTTCAGTKGYVVTLIHQGLTDERVTVAPQACGQRAADSSTASDASGRDCAIARPRRTNDAPLGAACALLTLAACVVRRRRRS